MESKILHWPEVGLGDAPLETGMTEAAAGGGLFDLAAFASAGVAIPVGSTIVAKIVDHYAGGFIYRLWTGQDETNNNALVSVAWNPFNGASFSAWGGPPTSGGAAWYLSGIGAGVAYADNCPCSNDFTNHNWDTTAHLTWASQSAGATTSGYTDYGQNMERTTFIDSEGHNGDCPFPQQGFCFILTRTAAQMSARLKTTGDTDASTCLSAGSNCQQIDPSQTCDVTCLEKALKAINAGDATKQSTAEAAAVSVLRSDAGLDVITVPDCIGATVAVCTSDLDAAGFTGSVVPSTADFAGADITKPALTIIEQPVAAGQSWGEADDFPVTVNPDDADMPFQFFRPLVGETYSDYIARLQAAGWLGTATEIDLTDDTGDPEWGPNGVPQVKIKLGTDTTETLLKSASWPDPAPKVKKGVNVEVYVNPGDFAPVTPEPPPADPTDPGDPPGVTIPPLTGSCGPNVPSLDMSPLEGLDFGEKFPFGVFGYVSSVLSPLVADPLTPVFDVPITIDGHTANLHVDLSPLDPYMATIRLLAEIGIGLTSVYLLASSLLGFKAGSSGGGLDMDTNLGDD